MVNINLETVAEFRKMFKEQYGVEYSDKEAWEATHNLLGFFDLLLEMDREQHPENYRNRKDKSGNVIE
ncbi:MAG: hypothetical protein M1320_02225 [Patescibacteria group bacterium]|nr:hypothetical protein [Patescibacteria group bacterium]